MLCANCGIDVMGKYYRVGGTSYCSVSCSYQAYEGLYSTEYVDKHLVEIKKAPKCGNTSEPVKNYSHSKHNKKDNESEQEHHYECVIKFNDHILTVNVFTESTDKQVIKELAIQEAVHYQKEMGISCSDEDMKSIGYKLIKPFYF